MGSFDFRDRHVLVAGVGAGIGSACVRAFVEGGARVSCLDIEPTVAAHAATLAPENALALAGDARRLEDVHTAVEAAVARFGPVHIAVDVIGETRWGRTLEIDDETWDDSFDIVVRHFFNVARATGPVMAQNGGGAIVAIGSVSGLRSAPLHGPYGAAKAALLSLVRTLAVELATDQVRVNAVVPGAVLTPRVAEMLTEERRAASAAHIPLGRLATPDDIAHAVAFLASDLAQYITGQAIVVDGGATIQFPLSLRA